MTRNVALSVALLRLCFVPRVFQAAFAGLLLVQSLPELGKAGFECVPPALKFGFATHDVGACRVKGLQ